MVTPVLYSFEPVIAASKQLPYRGCPDRGPFFCHVSSGYTVLFPMAEPEIQVGYQAAKQPPGGVAEDYAEHRVAEVIRHDVKVDLPEYHKASDHDEHRRF